jgi:hypothetical protein
MKKLAILSLTLISVNALSAQKLNNKEVPAVIKAAFQKQYPTITDVDWEKENLNFEAEFEVNEVEMSVIMDAQGNILETEVEIKTTELPANASKYIQTNYANVKIDEAAKITDSKGIVTYEAEIKHKDLIFDANGKFMKEVKD